MLNNMPQRERLAFLAFATTLALFAGWILYQALAHILNHLQLF